MLNPLAIEKNFQVKMELKVNFVSTENFAKLNVQQKAKIIRFFILWGPSFSCKIGCGGDSPPDASMAELLLCLALLKDNCKFSKHKILYQKNHHRQGFSKI